MTKNGVGHSVLGHLRKSRGPLMRFMMEHVDGRLLKLAVYYLYNCDDVTGICNNTDRPTIAKVTGISQGQI